MADFEIPIIITGASVTLRIRIIPEKANISLTAERAALPPANSQ